MRASPTLAGLKRPNTGTGGFRLTIFYAGFQNTYQQLVRINVVEDMLHPDRAIVAHHIGVPALYVRL